MTYSGTDVLENFIEAVNYNEHLISRVLRWAPPKVKGFFDFGSGIGTFASNLRTKGYSITCIEPDKLHCEILEQNGFSIRAGLDEIPNDTIDYLYSLNVLEHIQEDQKILDQMYQKASKGGKIYIFVPAFSVLYSSFDKRVGHVRRYSQDDLLAKVKKAGFVIETTKYIDSIGFFAALVYKFLDNGKGELKLKQLLFYDRVVLPFSLAFDFIFSKFFGKNIEVIAYKK